jgi:hypothetical protein
MIDYKAPSPTRAIDALGEGDNAPGFGTNSSESHTYNALYLEPGVTPDQPQPRALS